MSENTWTGIGNLGRDAEVFTTATGATKVTFSMATNFVWRDKESGELQKRTTWHTVYKWDPTEWLLDGRLCKGAKVWVKGPYEDRKYTDRDGNERTAKEVNAERIEVFGRRDEAGAEEQPTRQPAAAKAGPAANGPVKAKRPAVAAAQRPQPRAEETYEDDDDDPVPF